MGTQGARAVMIKTRTQHITHIIIILIITSLTNNDNNDITTQGNAMIVDKKGYLTRSSHRLRSILQKQMTKIRQFSTLDNKQHCHSLIDISNVKEWSIKNVKIARKIMEVPKPPFCLNKYIEWKDDRVANDLLIDYLEWREWDVCNTKNNTDLYTSCNLDNDEKLQMSQTLLSHALTFPLTLGNHMNYLI